MITSSEIVAQITSPHSLIESVVWRFQIYGVIAKALDSFTNMIIRSGSLWTEVVGIDGVIFRITCSDTLVIVETADGYQNIFSEESDEPELVCLIVQLMRGERW